MKECPFCGASGSALQRLLSRVACLDCGAAGPVCGEDPEGAWEMRFGGCDVGLPSLKLEPMVLGCVTLPPTIDIDIDIEDEDEDEDPLALDGSLQSIRRALDEIRRSAR